MNPRFTVTLHEPGDCFVAPLPGAAYLSACAVPPPLGWPMDPRTTHRDSVKRPCIAVTWVQSIGAQLDAQMKAERGPSPAERMFEQLARHEAFLQLTAEYFDAHGPDRGPSTTLVAEVMNWAREKLEAIERGAKP